MFRHTNRVRHWNMKEVMFIRHFIIACSLLSLTACSTSPITGRSQPDLVPGSSMHSTSLQPYDRVLIGQMSLLQYEQFLQEHSISTDQEQAQMVRRVGTKIQHAVERYFAANGMSKQLVNYTWEFKLVEDELVDAWCMPGGRVVVYTGILPMAKDETGLAVVLGHEIAHTIAKHVNERISQALMAQMGGISLSTALSAHTTAARRLLMTAYGAGAQYGEAMPYNKTQENEADHLGLIFMAMAGYDPNEAVTFWERMAARKNGQEPPEFLSTHPSDATRIANIKRLIPETVQQYKK